MAELAARPGRRPSTRPRGCGRAILAALIVLSLSWAFAAATAQAQTAEEASLLTRVPEPLRPACVAEPPLSPDGLARLRCDLLAADGLVVSYESFANHLRLSDLYRRLIGEAPGTRYDTGECPGGLPSEGRLLSGRVVVGRYACHVLPPGEARVVWMHSPTGVLAVARRPDGDMATLALQWPTAGPVGPVAPSRFAIGGLFPDPREVAFMTSLPTWAGGCERIRFPRGANVVSIVSVSCLTTNRQTLSGFSLFTSTRQAVEAYERFLAAARILGGPGPTRRCAANARVEAPYSVPSGPRGRFVCLIFMRVATIAWYDLRRPIFALVARSDRNLVALERWWRQRRALR